MTAIRNMTMAIAVLCMACSSSGSNASATVTPIVSADGGETIQDTNGTQDASASSDGAGTSTDGASAGVDATTSDGGSAADGGGPTKACPHSSPFDDSANGSEPYEKVGDFMINTVDGPISLSKLWTGCGGHMFVINHPDPKYAAYAGAIWKTDPNVVLKQAPKWTHWYFLSYSPDAQATAEVTAQREKWLNALLMLPKAEQEHWKPRLHFVTGQAWNLPGWIGQTLKKKSVFHFGIDAQQRRREIGLARMPIGNQPGNLRHLMLETKWYQWEVETDHKLAQLKKPTVVTIFDKVPVHSGWGYKKHFVQVELPNKAKMAEFDSAYLEIAHGCQGGIDKNCPDWDRETSLFLCDRAKDTAVPPPSQCTKSDAKPCPCIGSDGSETKGTQKCNKDGKGYGACQCGCAEFARQISTYKRHGRWLTDVSPLLPLLKAGGKQRFAYATVDKWITTAKLWLHNAGKKTRPTSIQFLWTGGQYNEKYNDAHKPITVTVPANTKKARIVTLLSGHGSATDTYNCAEFCPHSHHFSVKTKGASGAGAQAVKNHQLVNEGCLKLINQGVVPNQFGTWPYARAGWCPGWDVKLWTADVTAGIKAGEQAEIQYKSLLFGKNFTPNWTGKGDYKPVIKMRSWIVFEQ